MSNLKAIKTRINSIKSTRQITKAMKMVSAAKMRRVQERMEQTRPYSARIRAIIDGILPAVEVLEQPLLQERDVRVHCVVVVTADRGLCGAFNSNIIKKAAEQIAELSKTSKVVVYTIGKIGYDFFRKRNYDMLGHHIQFFNYLDLHDAENILKDLLDAYNQEKVDKIHVVFNEFKSAIQQTMKVEQFLPLTLEATEEVVSAAQIVPLYEPDKDKLLSVLIPRNLRVQLWRYLVESNAAEEGARMVAMDSATENANDMIEKLKLTYNRSRQAAITTEIAEIVGGAEALKG
jgi:F-type H+-transporting ATPase subunit gamma